MEFFPHEWRFFKDGALIRREPDRLIPRSDHRHDFVSEFPRMLTPVNFAQFDVNGPLRLAARNSDAVYQARKAAFKTVFGTESSTYIDYFKVWDLPSDYIIPKFPY